LENEKQQESKYYDVRLNEKIHIDYLHIKDDTQRREEGRH